MDADIPTNAPKSCPGTSSMDAGKSRGCDGCPNQSLCATGSGGKMNEEVVKKIQHRMAKIKNIIIVMSGKGGVGKSSIASILTWALSSLQNDKRVGILDIDITGPTIPIMMGCEQETVHNSGDGWSPVFVDENLEVMSAGMLLSDPDQAIIWRGPKKNSLIEKMLTDVDWSELDYLIVDTPPGTTDEHMSIVNYLKAAGVIGKTRALIVSTNQEVALSDVRKQLGFCSRIELPVVGVVGNMSNHCCTNCGLSQEVFPCNTGGVAGLCADYGVTLLAQLPVDSRLTRCLDNGISVMTTDEEDCLGEVTMDAIEVMVGSLIKSLRPVT